MQSKSIQNTRTMEKIVELIMKNDGLDETEAKLKANLLYIKLNQAEVKDYHDEYIEWLMTEKNLNYKAILQTSDHDLHELYISEFKR